MEPFQVVELIPTLIKVLAVPRCKSYHVSVKKRRKIINNLKDIAPSQSSYSDCMLYSLLPECSVAVKESRKKKKMDHQNQLN